MLYPFELSTAARDNFIAISGDWPGLIVDEDTELHTLGWDAIQSHRHALRSLRAELTSTNRALNPSERDVLRVSSALLQDVNAECDLRTEAGDRGPRRSAGRGRQTAPNSGDAHPLPVLDDDGRPMGSSFGSAGASHSPPVIDLATRPASMSARALFGSAPARSAGKDETFARYLRAIQTRDSAWLESRPLAAAANTQVGAEGAWAVPVGINLALWEAVVAQSRFLRFCRAVRMRNQTETFPVVNVTNRALGPSGFTAPRVGEGAKATAQTPIVSEIVLRAQKKVVYWDCTREWLADAAPGSDQVLIDSAASTVALQLDRDILSGSGASEPLGVFNADALIASAKDGGQTSNTITYSNLTTMLTRLLPPSFDNCVWFVSHTALAQLFSVYLPVGTAGGLPAPLAIRPDGTFALFGRPLIVSDFMPALSSKGDVALLDLSWHIVGLREQLRVDVSEHFKFDEDKVSFRVVVRRDAQPIITGPITPAVGSTTVSPLVALEAR